jgi:prevent-host-death family protein
MNTLEAKEAGEKLDRILDEAAEAHQPVLITSLRVSAVLVPGEDWNAIKEALYLLSVPGMREAIRAGLETPLEECEKEPGW